MVWGSYRDSLRRLWVGTNNGIGIWLPAERRWRIIHPSDGLAAHRVLKFALGPDGRIWSLSPTVGLNRFDPQSLAPENVPLPSPETNAPTAMASAPDGSLWVASNQNLFAIRRNGEELAFETVPAPEGGWKKLREMSIAKDGAVWVSSTEGVSRFHRGSWKRFDSGDGLLADRVIHVLARSKDELFLSYEEARGITRLILGAKEVRTEHFTTAQGMLSDRVWMLGADLGGRIWVGGTDGLSAIEPDGSIRIFDQGDGLIWNNINREGLWAEPDGSVFIGTTRGLAHYRPAGEPRASIS